MGKGKKNRKQPPPFIENPVPTPATAAGGTPSHLERASLRRRITVMSKAITAHIAGNKSRTALQKLLAELVTTFNESERVNVLLSDPRNLVDFDEQYVKQIEYMTLVEDAKEEVRQYLDDRKDDPLSDILPPDPNIALLEEQRRLKALADQKEMDDARQLLVVATKAVKDLEEKKARTFVAPRPLITGFIPPEPSVGGHHKAASWLHRLPDEFESPYALASTPAPDDWIEEYYYGREDPSFLHSHRKGCSVQASLEEYNGNVLDWFQWIDLFHVLVHLSQQSPGEKLAILKRHLKGDALLIVRSLGGGEDAYREALFRLKESCGRRGVMRQAHKIALDRLDYKKGDYPSFKKYAEHVRSHLFDLDRIGGSSSCDLIEHLCMKLEPMDRVAWTDRQSPGVEIRSLNEFGTWLCKRASAYLNDFSLAAAQSEDDHHPPRFGSRSRHSGSTNKASGTVERRDDMEAAPRRIFCFQCEKTDHQIFDCKQFKDLTAVKRFEFASRHRLCFLCLRSGHSTRDCRSGKPCEQRDCKFKHHILLHDSTIEQEMEGSSNHLSSRPRRVAFGVIPVDVIAPNGSTVPANLLYDDGSDITLLSEDYAKNLKLPGERHILNMSGVGGIVTRHDSLQVHLNILSPSGEKIQLVASTLETVARSVPVTHWRLLKDRWKHLEDLPLPDSGGRIDILLGLDYAHLMVALETRVGAPFEPVAVRTVFGWVARGVVEFGKRDTSARINTVFCSSNTCESLAVEFRKFCEMESFGTEHKGDCISAENQRAVTMAENGLERLPVGVRVPILWKEGEPNLPFNLPMVEHRFRGLLKRFEKDPVFENEYRTTMEKYFAKGYARKLSDEEAAIRPTYYLPHHGVYKIVMRKRKLRVVFDAAARYQGKCMNDAVTSGPVLQNQLASVLLKFREGAVAFSSDIEAMFSRIRLRPEDAVLHRFLWNEKGSDVIIHCQMDRLIFGNGCSPFLAIYATRRVAQDDGEGMPDAVNAINKNLYVDDYLDSARTVREAVYRAKEVKSVLEKGDFNLPEWSSNSSEFLQAMTGKAEEKESVPDPLLGTSSAESKVLGVYWKPKEDTLTFDVYGLEDVTYSRVGIVSKVAGVYDPLGFAAPIIIKAKIKLRELGTRGLKWDDSLLEEDAVWWRSWFAVLPQLNNLSIPRCLFPDETNIISTELHTMSDASEEAFASVAYLRHLYSNGKIAVRIVMAKSKLAPKKTISVAKLELNAALLGSRLAAFVIDSLTRTEIEKFYWTDSSCVRNWIRATSAFYKPFVSNRIGEIQTLTESTEWRFVPGRMNSSDAATRSLLVPEDIIPQCWTDGPEFLYLQEKEWPKDLPWMVVTDESRSGRVHHAAANKIDWSSVHIQPANLNCLLNLEGDFPALIRNCQEEVFPEEIRRLKAKKHLLLHSKILALTPQLDKDGIMRLGGRVGKAELPYDSRHPVVLPADHPFTAKVILAFHQHLFHPGVDYLLMHLRQHFWVIHGREAIKKIRRRCIICKKETARPAVQLMGELPSERLDFGTLPFTRTAVDYFGPIDIGFGRNKTAKRYGALFTCLVTRAVYLDLSISLSTDDFLLVYRRFISTHRKPESIHSDNGLNFVGAERVMNAAVRELNESEDLQAFNQEKGIDWRFQPPAAPHFGGAHESLVKSAKKALYKMLEAEELQGRLPTEDQLRTLFFEVSGILNSRPLTYVSSDPNDFRPLTPNDFLNKPPTTDVPRGDFIHAHPRESYRYLQRTANLFWDIYKKQYVQSQALRRKWKAQQRNFVINDIVLVIDPSLKRGQWSIGTITETFPGDDKLVRVVRVKTEKGEYIRPIDRLCLLQEKEESDPIASVESASGENVAAI